MHLKFKCKCVKASTIQVFTMLVNENTLKLQSRMAAEVGEYYAANRTCMWQPAYYGVTYRSKFSQGISRSKNQFSNRKAINRVRNPLSKYTHGK